MGKVTRTFALDIGPYALPGTPLFPGRMPPELLPDVIEMEDLL